MRKVILRVAFLCVIFSTSVLTGLYAADMTSQCGNLKVRIDTQDEDGVFYGNQEVQCFVEVENTADANEDINLEWNISTDDWRPLMQQTLPVHVKRLGSLKAYCPWFEFPETGFYRVSAKIISDAKTICHVSMVIGINPEELRPPFNAPSDLFEFWGESIAELEKVKPAYSVKPIEREGKFKTNLYEVEMKSFGGLTVRGWLEIPKKKGNYPALLRVPGYTENLQPLDKYDDMIIFSFNTRDHGESDDTGKRGYDMWVRGMESKEGYYYRGIFLDCIRALDYLESRDDVIMDKLAIWGGSQGGGLSFAIAALDQRVKLCIADIPYMCDYPRYFAITHWNEIDDWFAKDKSHTWELMYHTLDYFDTKYMAHKIKCPVLMGIGLQDDTCPPSTSFMTYNLIESEKEFDIYKTEKHAQPDSHYENRFLRIRQIFEMD
jgi:cephalosporin-C deacetylase